jgi:hypothetical protein
MRFLLLGALFGLLAGFIHAQQAAEPKYDISPNIAKIPERSDFIGTWLRGDGGYRIEVAAGADAGTVVVQYFNPEPINVESAVFEVVDGGLFLKFVLRDAGYPGSAYELMFLSERRILFGDYARPGAEPAQVYFLNQGE